MAIEIHALKLLGEGQPTELAVLPYQTSSPAYFGAPVQTPAEWRDLCREHDLEAALVARGLEILAGDETLADEVIDLAAFTRLYHRLHTRFGFLRTPTVYTGPEDEFGRTRLTIGEARVLTTGIRFLREFYDDATFGGVTAPAGLVRLVP